MARRMHSAEGYTALLLVCVFLMHEKTHTSALMQFIVVVLNLAEPPSDIKPSIIDISPRALFIEFDWSPPKNVVVSNYHVRVTWNSRGSRSYHSYNTSAEDNSFKAVFPITSDVTVSIEIQVFTENICRQLSIGSASFTQKFKITKRKLFLHFTAN